MKDCTFANDRWDFGSLKLLGPAGPFTFGLYNSAFYGHIHGNGGALQSGQHCGHAGAGGPCTVHYLLEKVDFSGLTGGGAKIRIGVPMQVKDQGYVDPVFVARDNSLGGYRSIVSHRLNGFEAAGCKPLGPEWDHGFGCSAPARRLNLWGPDAGLLQLKGPGYAVPPTWDAPTVGRNAGKLYWDSQHDGYGLPVLAGQSYTLSGNFNGQYVVEFSDGILADYFGAPEQIRLKVGNHECELKASDDRSFISPFGNKRGVGWTFRPLPSHHVIEGGSLRCADASQTTTVRRRLTAMSTSSTTTTTSRAPSSQATPQATDGGSESWQHHPDLNCYPGQGGGIIPGKDLISNYITIEDCQAACEKEAACEAIVMPTGQSRGQCWFRTAVDINSCLPGKGYDLWVRR